MIIKIKTYKRPAYRKLLEYMLKDGDKLHDKEKRTFVISHNLKGRTIDQWVKQYAENETYRKIKRKDSIKITHEILSWHKDDTANITIEKLEDMAREYMQKRNPNAQYIAVPHFDKDHYHVHVAVSGLEYRTGKSMRMTKGNFQKLKKDIQAYQLEHYPELTNSVVSHEKQNENKPKETDKEYQYKRRTGRKTDKEQLQAILQSCFKASTSKEDFYKKLKENKLKTYQRGGKTTGIFYKNQKFRLNKLGFTPERLAQLNKALNRESEIISLRGKKERQIHRNR